MELNTILENDTSEDNSNRYCQCANKAKSCSRRRNILSRNSFLQCNQNSLEVWTDPEVCNELVDDDFWLAFSDIQIKEQPRSQSYENEA